MLDNIDWNRALQLLSVAGAAHLAGFGLASDKVALPNAAVNTERDKITKDWFRAWDFGRKYGPFAVMATTTGFAASAWLNGTKDPRFIYNLVAAISMALITPYTVFVVFPINDKLLAENSKITDSKKTDNGGSSTRLEVVRQWALEWKTVDLNRTLLANVAAVAGLIAASWK